MLPPAPAVPPPAPAVPPPVLPLPPVALVPAAPLVFPVPPVALPPLPVSLSESPPHEVASHPQATSVAVRNNDLRIPSTSEHENTPSSRHVQHAERDRSRRVGSLQWYAI